GEPEGEEQAQAQACPEEGMAPGPGQEKGQTHPLQEPDLNLAPPGDGPQEAEVVLEHPPHRQRGPVPFQPEEGNGPACLVEEGLQALAPEAEDDVPGDEAPPAIPHLRPPRRGTGCSRSGRSGPGGPAPRPPGARSPDAGPPPAGDPAGFGPPPPRR